MNKYDTKVSKFLSFILRHSPDSIGITLDENGFVGIDEILAASDLSREQILLAVEHNEKKRFEIVGDKIRASQGHSIQVDLELKEVIPPAVLYHGTVDKFIASIKTQGLLPMSRQHVHLSAAVDTAVSVGSRRGKPVILEIDTQDLVKNGHKFFLSNNNVWLTSHIPPESIKW